jgi:Tfp pilus assembly protein PilF
MRGNISKRKLLIGAWFALNLVICGGCALSGKRKDRGYSTLPETETKNLAEARSKNGEGLEKFDRGDLGKAEALFRDALAADPNFGPAHNNLGQVFLAQHQLYLAAWEFELAANLMPGRVEPILNQGLVYETADRLDQASSYYSEAFAMEPRNPVAIGNLARLRVKQDDDPDEVNFLLKELVLHDDRPDWIAWAEELLATRYSDVLPSMESSRSERTSLGEPSIELEPMRTPNGSPEPIPVPGPVDQWFPEPERSSDEEESAIEQLPGQPSQREGRSRRLDVGKLFPAALNTVPSNFLSNSPEDTQLEKVSFDEILQVERSPR